MLFGERFEIRVGFAVRCEYFIEPLAGGVRFGERFFNRFANGFVRVEFRFLFQKADRQIRHRRGLAVELRVYTRHDAQQ